MKRSICLWKGIRYVHEALRSLESTSYYYIHCFTFCVYLLVGLCHDEVDICESHKRSLNITKYYYNGMNVVIDVLLSLAQTTDSSLRTLPSLSDCLLTGRHSGQFFIVFGVQSA